MAMRMVVRKLKTLAVVKTKPPAAPKPPKPATAQDYDAALGRIFSARGRTCMYVREDGGRRLIIRVHISCSTRAVLERVQRRFGGGLHSHGSGYLLLWRKHADVWRVLTAVLPHVTGNKLQKVQAGIDYLAVRGTATRLNPEAEAAFEAFKACDDPDAEFPED